MLVSTALKDQNNYYYPTLEEQRVSGDHEVTVEYSNNMQFLQQYFYIREYIYTRDLNLKSFSGDEDSTDQYSQFIIARKGMFCFGGARLTISPVGNRKKLPLEDTNFNILDMYPELADEPYCELGRTAILPKFRDGECLDQIFALSAEIAISRGCRLLFGASPKSVARRFKASFNKLGYPTIIHSTIKPPMQRIHEGLGLNFLIINLAPNEIDVTKFDR